MKVITDKYKEMGKMSLHEAQVFYIYCALLLLLASLTSTRRWARWVCTRRRYFFIYCALLLLLASLTVQGDGQDDPA